MRDTRQIAPGEVVFANAPNRNGAAVTRFVEWLAATYPVDHGVSIYFLDQQRGLGGTHLRSGTTSYIECRPTCNRMDTMAILAHEWKHALGEHTEGICWGWAQNRMQDYTGIAHLPA